MQECYKLRDLAPEYEALQNPSCDKDGPDVWGCQWLTLTVRCLQGDAEDSAGMRGIHLQRNVVAVAQKALTANLRLLGPLVLPLPELVTIISPH